MNPNEREYNDFDMPQIEEVLPEGECQDVLEYESQFGDEDRDCMLDEPHDMTDVEADADTLASAGWGTDEDYGYYGGYED